MKLQKEIIELLGTNSNINPKTEINKLINFLKDYLKKNIYLKKFILGISGGQDSTLTGKLCQLAINELKKKYPENNYKFIAVRLPCGIQKDEKDCKKALKFICPDQIIRINIYEIIEKSFQIIKSAGIILSDFVKGNLKARERMKILYSIAAMKNGIVVGTSNASEIATGFFTKYGDNGSDITPISTLNKRQGKKILKILNCPPQLYLKDPTADLEENYPQKKDEDVLGIKYDVIDSYLEGKKINPDEQKIIENLYLKTKHKREKTVNIHSFYQNI